MARNYFFSINLLIKSESHLENSINSVIGNKKFFSENVQLLLIDTVCSDFSTELCSKYSSMFPENVYFIDCAGKTVAESYNDAAPLCSGQYVSYIDNYSEYSPELLSKLYTVVQKGRIPIVCVQPLIDMPGSPVKPYVDDIKKGLVKLRDKPDSFILLLGCYFFNRKVIEGESFDTQLRFHYDAKFITEMLLKTYSYIFLDDLSYTTSSPTEKDFTRYEGQYSRAFYTNSVNSFIIPMLTSYVGSVLVQSVMMYLINVKLSLNADERYKNIIIGNYVTEFIDTVAVALKYIDDAVILSKRLCRTCMLDPETPFRLIRLKYKDKKLFPHIESALPDEEKKLTYYNINSHAYNTILSGEFIASVNDAIVTRSVDISAEIVAINYDESGLYIDARLSGCACLDENDFTVYAVVNRKKQSVIKSEVYTLCKLFDISFLKKYSFRFFVPVSDGKNIDTVFLVMRCFGLSLRLKLGFNGNFSRLSSRIKSSYWHFLDRILTYDEKGCAMVIRKATDSLCSMCESKYLSEISQDMSIADAIYYRQIRHAVRKNRNDKNRVPSILFFDNSGVNYNGNLLFRYFSRFSRPGAVDVYFCARADSEEHAFLLDSEYEHVLTAGSRKCKVQALSGDVIVSTEYDTYNAIGFSEADRLFLRDLMDVSIVSIKNSFSVKNSAQFDNRLRDNAQLVLCASRYEKENLCAGIYDYDESMIRVVGYPMLDALKDDKQKVILLSPCERRIFQIYENSGFYHFADSRFFKAYNALLTNTELQETLRKNGYTLAVLLPKSIEKYGKMFYTNDVIKLYSNKEKNEQKLVKRARALITDYSELQYKFAYLNKPVIYYMPQGLPADSEYRNIKISRDGFGEMIVDPHRLNEYLKKNLPSGLTQPLRFEQRTKEFFRYKDSNNCKRVMQLLLDSFIY